MPVIADLQLHSKHSRAVSRDMVIPKIAEWAKRKGIGLVATGDWTHPLWLAEIKRELEELGNGLLRLKSGKEESPYFLLATEISCIYSQAGKGRRIHILVWVPTIAAGEKINTALIKRGANLISDGRPIVGLTSQQLADIVLSAEPQALLIPAHAWTPWFSLYGSESGFDSVEECFGNFSKNIYAIETGLSSDPAMNWRIKELDSRSILSFSDAHSGPKLGREATVFEIGELSFANVRKAIINKSTDYALQTTAEGSSQSALDSGLSHIAYTIEFFPEEGKYHYTGHRACGVKHSPKETKQKGTTCPVCGKKLTVGVMHRVEELAGREEAELGIHKKKVPGTAIDGVYSQTFPQRPPYVMLVPLVEILAEALGTTTFSQKAFDEYNKLTDNFAGEFSVLLSVPIPDIAKTSGEKVAEAVDKVRRGDIFIDPGYDGVFGKVAIWGKGKTAASDSDKEQLQIF